MALHGELKTFPLPDLLQWLEGSRKPGRLTIISGGGDRVFLLEEQRISRYGAPGLYERMTRILRLVGALDELGGRKARDAIAGGMSAEQAFGASGVPEPLLCEMARDEALQSATDLFEDASATFHFGEELDVGDDETARVDLSLRELLYEAARRHDEAGPAGRLIESDATMMRPGEKTTPKPHGLAAAALAAVGTGATVGAVRLALGLSRTGGARILFELWRGGLLRVDGLEQPKIDPLTRMLQQGNTLLAQKQYDAAALVFSSLLAADPSDPRVREFARAVEREHVEALYNKLSPLAVPRLVALEASLAALRQDERIVASLINGRWDVSTLVLASPLRELQTLRAIERMASLEFVMLGTG